MTRLELLERELRAAGHRVVRDYRDGRWTVAVDGARVAEGVCIGDLEDGACGVAAGACSVGGMSADEEFGPDDPGEVWSYTPASPLGGLFGRTMMCATCHRPLPAADPALLAPLPTQCPMTEGHEDWYFADRRCTPGAERELKPLLIEVETTHGVESAYTSDVMPDVSGLLVGVFHGGESAPRLSRARALVRRARNAAADLLYRVADAVAYDRRDDC